MIMAKGAARRRYVLAAKVEDTAKRGKIAKWAIQSESKVKIDAALAMARCETPISDDGRDWDNRPMLLVVGNGVVDLTTGIRRDGVPDDRMVLYTPVQFDPEARPHRFEQFISEIFQGDLDLIDFVQRALGYSLTGQTIEQVLFILYGTGANGKSVFLSIIRAALGEYGYNMPFSTVELKARATIPNDVAALVDKRFVTASETNESARFNEARIKALTGCDPITARFMHSEFFTFRPVAKFWLSVNHKPQVSDDSYGFWRRVRLIPFTQQFKDDQADPNLEVKLREELPGILAWLVRGCLEWQRRGLKPPAVVLNATETYREESDPLGQFIAERCHLDGASTAPARELYRGYRSWAEEQGFRDREILTSQAFGRRVGDRFKKKHTRCGAVYEGLGLYV
jgi:putative DNA primase/helicase